MNRFVFALGGLAIGIVLAATLFISQPSQATAGGFACYFCHGDSLQGSDLAPALAGTKLTDEQIFKQLRSPRGVMPAFPEMAQSFTIDYIRSMPTGKPTAVLSSQQKSAALATIASIAASRATILAQAGYLPTATPSPAATNAPSSTPSPSPAATSAPSSTPSPSPAATSANPPASTASAATGNPFNLLVLIGGLLVMGVGIAWLSQRR